MIAPFALVAALSLPSGAPQSQRVVVGREVVGHAEADVDADGRCDLILARVPDAGGGERELLLFLQKEEGRFGESPDLRIPVKRDVLAWAVGDLLPDRGLELLFLTRGAAFAFVPRSAEYRDNARRLATFESLFEAVDPEELPRWPHLLDADGDGTPELFVPERHRVRAFGRNPKDPAAEWIDRGAVPARRDGAEELPRAGASRQGRRVTLRLGVGGPELGFSNDPFLVGPTDRDERGAVVSVENALHAPVLADADGDGRADVYLLIGGVVRIHRQDKSGRFPESPSWTGTLRKEEGWPDEVRVRDLDGDGRAELLALGSGEGGILGGDQVLEVLRGGSEAPALETPLARLKFDGMGLFVECVDVDADGLRDLEVALFDLPRTPETIAMGAKIRWSYLVFRGTREGGVERQAALRFSEEWKADAIAGMGMVASFGGDLDGDGALDFCRVGPHGRVTGMRIARGKDGTLSREGDPLFEVQIHQRAEDLAVLRLDGDARADVVVFHADGFTAILPR